MYGTAKLPGTANETRRHVERAICNPRIFKILGVILAARRDTSKG